MPGGAFGKLRDRLENRGGGGSGDDDLVGSGTAGGGDPTDAELLELGVSRPGGGTGMPSSYADDPYDGPGPQDTSGMDETDPGDRGGDLDLAPGEIQDEMVGLEVGDLTPFHDTFRDEQSAGGDEFIGTAQDFGGSMRDSQGYTGIQDLKDSWQGIYDQGGLTDQTRAQLASNRANAEQFGRGQREADLANLAERGMTGGGAELASLLGTQGAAADRLSTDDLNTAAFAEEQALNALSQSGEASESLYDKDFELDSAVKNAADAATLLDLGVSDQIMKDTTEVVKNVHQFTRDETGQAFGPTESKGTGGKVGAVTREEVGEGNDGITSVGFNGQPGVTDPNNIGAPTPENPEDGAGGVLGSFVGGASEGIKAGTQGGGSSTTTDEEKPKNGVFG